jgi:hypothetical protein
MGYFRDYVTGRTRTKIKNTQSKIRDVKALRKFKDPAGSAGLSTIERQGAKRAAKRLGDDMSMFSMRPNKRGRK